MIQKFLSDRVTQCLGSSSRLAQKASLTLLNPPSIFTLTLVNFENLISKLWEIPVQTVGGGGG